MRKKQEGFTLIETIISMAIFGLVIIAMVSMLQVNLSLTTRSRAIDQGSIKNSNAFLEGNITTSSPPTTVTLDFGEGKKLEVKGHYIETNNPTGNYSDKYRLFVTDTVSGP